MNYEISISVQEGSVADRNIKSVSSAQHVSPEEAALQIISGTDSGEESPASLVARVRAENTRRKSGTWPPAAPNGNADKLIGLLADSPETAEAIRSLADRSRRGVRHDHSR